MISIVVCSVKKDLFPQFCLNVESTIGVPYEIIEIDNSKNEYNLCQAYNKGKLMCKYEIICFSHEDVLFETANWGERFLNVFKNPEIGLAGLFGSCYLSLFPTNNWIIKSELEGQFRLTSFEKSPVYNYARFPGTAVTEVVAVDGMLLVTRKEIMQKIHFSEDILKGFHGYDIDLALQIREKYKVVVLRDVLIFHYSSGVFNESYYQTMAVLAKKWDRHLPAYLSSYTQKEIEELKMK